MKLEIEIGGRMMEMEFSSTPGTVQFTHNGETYEATVSEPEPGIFVIVYKNRVYRCMLDKLPDGRTEVIVNGRRIPVAAHDKKHLRGNVSTAQESGGRVNISAPMPGKVIRILLKAGDEIAAHQGIIIVEAMKMQNEVQSPKDGKVAEIRVIEGQTVNSGEVLAVIE
ncbi:MAG: biotin/lipoyl-binding protein [Acidobacteria bacterium]|nr:biotin/lipoyl-binding protein [Acidobacteriota bacterium]MCI0660024.1 biotin/lipoyl-binding protein [Acidobacteriota bacterium]